MIRPLGDRVVVETIESGPRPSGLVIPDIAKEKPRQGKVLSVGPGLPDETGKRVPPQVEVDEVVLFSPYGGIDVQWDNKPYLILREGDLLGVVEDDG